MPYADVSEGINDAFVGADAVGNGKVMAGLGESVGHVIPLTFVLVRLRLSTFVYVRHLRPARSAATGIHHHKPGLRIPVDSGLGRLRASGFGVVRGATLRQLQNAPHQNSNPSTRRSTEISPPPLTRK
jgi:hypothetical protein